MSKTKDIFEEKVKEQKRIHNQLLNKEINELNKKVKSEKYNVENMISSSSLGGLYHDLIDSKDKLNSEYQRKYNQTYHAIDVELYKLNKKIDREARMIDYKINTKKEEISFKIRESIM